jgi:hypothetical protein
MHVFPKCFTRREFTLSSEEVSLFKYTWKTYINCSILQDFFVVASPGPSDPIKINTRSHSGHVKGLHLNREIDFIDYYQDLKVRGTCLE